MPRYLTEPRNQPQNNDPDKPIKPPGWFFRTLLGVPPTYSHYDDAAQESAIKRMNQMVYMTDLFWNIDARNLIEGWYAPSFSSEKFRNNFVPPGWAENANGKKLYSAVVAPTCRTCHISHVPKEGFARLTAPDELRFGKFDDLSSRKTLILLLACTNHSSGLSMPNAEQTSNIFWASQARAYLLDGLNITESGCGLNLQTPSGVQARSAVQLPTSGVLQEYKTSSCTCTTRECLTEVENKYVGQIPPKELNGPSVGLIISEVIKCRQQILPTITSPIKSETELLWERELARAKMLSP